MAQGLSLAIASHPWPQKPRVGDASLGRPRRGPGCHCPQLPWLRSCPAARETLSRGVGQRLGSLLFRMHHTELVTAGAGNRLGGL